MREKGELLRMAMALEIIGLFRRFLFLSCVCFFFFGCGYRGWVRTSSICARAALFIGCFHVCTRDFMCIYTHIYVQWRMMCMRRERSNGVYRYSFECGFSRFVSNGILMST